MLLQPLRTAICIALSVTTLSGFGQLHIDGNVDMSNAPSGEQTISGLADPLHKDDLSAMGFAASGRAFWYVIDQHQFDTVRLVGAIPFGRPENGLLIRYRSDVEAPGDFFIGFKDSLAWPVLDSEGRSLTEGRFNANQVVQFQWQDSAFFLANAPTSTCPSGFLQVSGSLCIQQSDNSLVNWYEANASCEAKGAGLCTFAEYVHACRVLGSQMTGLFNNWEWIDDTSDHTHTADQAGRWDCHSNRSRGATYQDFANFRCCYLLR